MMVVMMVGELTYERDGEPVDVPEAPPTRGRKIDKKQAKTTSTNRVLAQQGGTQVSTATVE
jgi:hypothetical protein